MSRNALAVAPSTRPNLTEIGFIKAIAPEARRYFIAERKARWLTNVIVDHGTMKTFDLAGIAPDGIPYDIHITMPPDAELLDFLLLVMRHEGAPMIMRLDAAKIAAPLVHPKPRARVVVERHWEASQWRPNANRPCRPIPGMAGEDQRERSKRGNERRRLALAATDEAEPAVLNG